ncbi:MAG: lipopolysaccharide heptosyltransferase II [Bdellovibrionales bacterium]|nr:lipopolysaccharide heptosyltransferase II [Bdellovibrionales bacterium]
MAERDDSVGSPLAGTSERILLVQTGFLGDVVLSLPVVDALAELYPRSELFFLTTPGAAGLLRSHPKISQVLTYDKRGADAGLGGLRRMALKLQQLSISQAFSLHKSHRTALLLAFARIPRRYGFAEAAAPWLYHQTAHRTDLSHEVLRNLALLRVLGREPTATSRIVLPLDEATMHRAAELLLQAGERRVVGIAPGSVWPTKRWTTDGFAAVAAGLSRRGYAVALIGGPEDAAIGAEIERLANVPLLNLIGQAKLVESAAVIARLEALVTNDSAPLHLASATGVPIVALFCATVPEFGFGPWGVPSRVLEVTGLTCRPCGRHGGRTCPTGTHACQWNLFPSRVVRAVDELLSERQSETMGTVASGALST